MRNTRDLFKMKILMIHPHDIYSSMEPWTVRITAVAEEFVKKGHEVKLVYFPLPDDERDKLRCKEFKEFQTIPFSRFKWSFIKNIVKMYRLAKDADIIHLQKCFAIASLPALFAAYLRNKPIHYDWDDWEFKIYQFSPPSWVVGIYLNIMEMLIPRLVDTISVSSQNLKELAIKRGARKERIVEAHVCADLEKFNPQNSGEKKRNKYGVKSKLVMYLGQLHGGQYAELLLRAIRVVCAKKPETKFMIVGGGADLERLKDTAKELKNDERVIFTGAIEYDLVPEYLAAADVVVACFEDNDLTKSKSPLKIVEYMAAGKAIVASDVGEIPRMLSGSGILTEPGNIYSLAKGILKFLEDENLRKICEKKARKRAEEEFTWDVTADNILRAYDIAIKRLS
jgi:glycosyltransferase involved in cell wall biosynthesis